MAKLTRFQRSQKATPKKADKRLKIVLFPTSQGHRIVERTVGRRKVYEIYQDGKLVDKTKSLYGAEHIVDARYSHQNKK